MYMSQQPKGSFVSINSRTSSLVVDFVDQIRTIDKSLEENPNDYLLYSQKSSFIKSMPIPSEMLQAYETERASLQPSNSPYLSFHKAFALLELGELQDAQKQIEEAIEQHPKFLPNKLIKARILFALGDQKAAIEVFDELLKEDNAFIPGYLYRAQVYTQLKNYDQVQKDYNLVLDIDPNCIDACINYGVLLQHHLNEPRKALEYFEKAVLVSPLMIDCHLQKAVLLNQLGEQIDAMYTIDVALSLDRDNIEANYQKGTLLKDQGNNEYALKVFENVIGLAPNHWQAYFQSGEIYKNIQEPKKAIEMYERAIDSDPSRIEPYLAKVELLKDQNDQAGALKIIEEELQDKNDLQILQIKAKIYESIDKKQEAIMIYNQMIKDSPHNCYTHKQKADLLMEMNDYENAAEALQNAVQLSDQDYTTLYNYGECLFQLKKYSLSLEMFIRAEKINTQQVDLYRKKAKAYLELKKYEDAITQYNMMIDLEPLSLAAYCQKGTILTETDQYQLARECYDAAYKAVDKIRENTLTKLTPDPKFKHSLVTEKLIGVLKDLTRLTEQHRTSYDIEMREQYQQKFTAFDTIRSKLTQNILDVVENCQDLELKEYQKAAEELSKEKRKLEKSKFLRPTETSQYSTDMSLDVSNMDAENSLMLEDPSIYGYYSCFKEEALTLLKACLKIKEICFNIDSKTLGLIKEEIIKAPAISYVFRWSPTKVLSGRDLMLFKPKATQISSAFAICSEIGAVIEQLSHDITRYRKSEILQKEKDPLKSPEIFKKSYDVVKILQGSKQASDYIKKFTEPYQLIAYEDVVTLMVRLEQSTKINIFKDMKSREQLESELFSMMKCTKGEFKTKFLLERSSMGVQSGIVSVSQVKKKDKKISMGDDDDDDESLSGPNTKCSIF